MVVSRCSEEDCRERSNGRQWKISRRCRKVAETHPRDNTKMVRSGDATREQIGETAPKGVAARSGNRDSEQSRRVFGVSKRRINL